MYMRKKITLVLLCGVFCILQACDDSSDNSCVSQCIDNNMANLCVDGKLVPTPCPNGCLNGACVSATVCSNGSTMCDTDGIPLKCEGSVWVRQAACGSDLKCVNGFCTKSDSVVQNCTNDEVMCGSDGIPLKCVNNSWAKQAACADGLECSEGRCQLPAVVDNCMSGSTKCDENSIPNKCIGNRWVKMNPCSDGRTCVNGYCAKPVTTKACNTGSMKCDSDGAPIICENNDWVKQDPCPKGKMCVYGKCTDMIKERECTNGSVKCGDNNAPIRCEGNAWVKKDPCPKDQKCVYGSCVGSTVTKECTGDSGQCTKDGVPQKCIDGKWTDQKPCGKDEKCSSGNCVATELCWNVTCKDDETCVNSVCVPNWELEAADGTKCDTDTFVEYCTDSGEAVACATTKGIYRNQCPEGCKVGDFTEIYGDTWHPAFCDSFVSEFCKGTTPEEVPYCSSETKKDGGLLYYESTYQCAPAFGGGYLALNYADFGYYTLCQYECDDDNLYCSKLPPVIKCAEPDSCSGEELSYCSNGKIEKIDCVEFEAHCKSFAAHEYADCFDETDECTKLNEVKKSCETQNSVDILTEKTCLHADNDSGSKNYWVRTKRSACSKGCNQSKDGCAE